MLGFWVRIFNLNLRVSLTRGDLILCVLSIVVAAANRPLQLILRLWPYLTTLASFVAFVVWNGGVVLGKLIL